MSGILYLVVLTHGRADAFETAFLVSLPGFIDRHAALVKVIDHAKDAYTSDPYNVAVRGTTMLDGPVEPALHCLYANRTAESYLHSKLQYRRARDDLYSELLVELLGHARATNDPYLSPRLSDLLTKLQALPDPAYPKETV